MSYSVIEHTADIALRIEADSLKGLFEEAAAGTFSLLLESRPEEREWWTIEVEGDDWESLLYSLLNELIFRFSSEGMLLSRAVIKELGPEKLTLEGFGEYYDPARHELLHDLKAATYHGLKIARTDKLWNAQIIFDV